MKSRINTPQLRTKFRFFVSIAIASIILLAMVVPTFAAESSEIAADPDEVPPVSVPIVLDGVLYQPAEFNKIHSELHAKGIYLSYVTDFENGIELAFTSREAIDKWLQDHGLSTMTEIEKGVKNAEPVAGTSSGSGKFEGILRLDYYMDCYEHISYGGSKRTFVDDEWVSNLHSESWGDRISSIYASDYYAMIIYEDINYGGDEKYIGIGMDYSNLHDYGWGDRISSVKCQ